MARDPAATDGGARLGEGVPFCAAQWVGAPAWTRCCSILLTMKRLVSRKRSTQLARQLPSEREKPVEGVPVMHLTHCVGSDEAK